MPEPETPQNAAELAKVLPSGLLGLALNGGITHVSMDRPGQEDSPAAAAIKSPPGQPIAGMEEILPGVPSRLRSASRSEDPLMKTIAGPDPGSWWD